MASIFEENLDGYLMSSAPRLFFIIHILLVIFFLERLWRRKKTRALIEMANGLVGRDPTSAFCTGPRGVFEQQTVTKRMHL